MIVGEPSGKTTAADRLPQRTIDNRSNLKSMKVVRFTEFLLMIVAGIAALCALGAILFTYFHGGPTYQHAIGWAMWIGGALVALLVAQSGSTTQMAGASRVVVGGRFALGSDIPQPTSPWFLIPAGVLVIALGTLIYSIP